MKADIVYDYKKMPEEEISRTEDVLSDSKDHDHVETIRMEKNIGGERVFLGIILYREASA